MAQIDSWSQIVFYQLGVGANVKYGISFVDDTAVVDGELAWDAGDYLFTTGNLRF
jgi:hypothetical protein